MLLFFLYLAKHKLFPSPNCFNFFSALSFSSLFFALCVVFTAAHSELLLINQQPFFHSSMFAHAKAKRPVEANRLIGLSRGLQLMMTEQMKRFFHKKKSVLTSIPALVAHAIV